MSAIRKNTAWFLFAFFAVGVGLYPLAYLITDMSGGLLGSKSSELLASPLWQLGFKLHIFGGGLALLSGWPQFIKKWRQKNIQAHRFLGRIYVITVLISGFAGLYISLSATGGLASILGFFFLAIAWLSTTLMAYVSIKKKAIDYHQAWMIRSYALCFAAVTLRLWLPVFDIALGMGFYSAYPIIAWLCWVPNLFVAEIIICRINLPTKVL